MKKYAKLILHALCVQYCQQPGDTALHARTSKAISVIRDIGQEEIRELELFYDPFNQLIDMLCECIKNGDIRFNTLWFDEQDQELLNLVK